MIDIMRKKMALAGLILLIIGVVLFFGGGDLGLHGIVKTETMTQTSSGIYQSTSFTVVTGNVTIVTSDPASGIYIVHTSDAHLVDASNIAQYALMHGIISNTSGVGTLTFTSMMGGTYTIISITNSSTSPHITLTNESEGSLLFSLLPTILGMLFGFVGLIVLIVGLILKTKRPALPDAAY
jgi:hypothetical protein